MIWWVVNRQTMCTAVIPDVSAGPATGMPFVDDRSADGGLDGRSLWGGQIHNLVGQIP